MLPRLSTRMAFALAGAAAVVAGAVAGPGGGAAAAAPVAARAVDAARALPAKYAKFANCPVKNPKVNYCLAASQSSTFTIGTTTLHSNGPVTLDVGLIENAAGNFTVVLPTDGKPAISAKPITIPGGLTGNPNLPLVDITATPELAGTPTFSLTNLELESGTAIALPLEISVKGTLQDLSFLGNVLGNCTIGTAASPIRLRLTDGRTKPPKPNKPITGGLLSLSADSNGVLTASVKLVDNAFAVPGASNCAALGLIPVNSLVDNKEKLPSAAGHNAAVMTGTSGLAPASVIRKYLG